MKSRLARFFRMFTILVIVLIVLLYIGVPAAAGILAVMPGRYGVGAAPDGFTKVTLQTDDAVSLQAWYHKSANGAVIILLHGAGGSREPMRAYAQMLAKHGFGVLALDQRGHGESQGITNRLGWQGTLDVGAAVRFLQAQGEVQRIGGFGSSMGGEVLLGAASAYPEIQAIVADGATRRCLEEYLVLEENRPLFHNFTTRVQYLTVQLLTGTTPPEPPLLQSMVNAPNTHFFLIAGGAKTNEVAFNQHFKDTLGPRADLWIAPNAAHVEAFGLYPDEYEQRVIEFFRSELVE